MTRPIKLASISLALALGLVGTGYGCAWLKVDACRTIVVEELARKPVFGRDLHGNKLRVAPAAVSARVSGPFQVEVWYLVPYDLHGSIHTQKFRVLPWGIKRSSVEIIDLV